MKFWTHCLLGAAALLCMRIPAIGQTLNWSSPVINNPAMGTAGGSYERPGVSTAIFNGEIWAAFTTKSCSGSDCYMILANTTGGTSTTFENFRDIYISSSFGYAMSNQNPALVATNGKLWLTWVDSSNHHYIASSTDGEHWDFIGDVIDAPTTVYSPSVAVNPSNPDIIYIGYMNSVYHTPVLCTYDTTNANNQSCQNLTNLRTMNFNPGMAFFQGELYMGFEDRGNSHCLYFYKYNPSNNSFTFWNPASCDEQTSTAPSLATFNNDLYIAFRTNDSSQKFTVRVTTNGSDWGYRQQPGWAMDGPPDLLDLNPTQNTMMNAFVRSNYLQTSIGSL